MKVEAVSQKCIYCLRPDCNEVCIVDNPLIYPTFSVSDNLHKCFYCYYWHPKKSLVKMLNSNYQVEFLCQSCFDWYHMEGETQVNRTWME